jgi:glutamate carboxypeptidase
MRAWIRLGSAAALAACLAFNAAAQPVEPVLAQVGAQKGPFLSTVRELVDIESGSADREGLDRIAELIAAKLRALGGAVEIIETPESELVRRASTPEKPGRMVRAVFKGTGTKKVLLIAHMDTVYPRGMLARQPFRVDGNRAYGLGISDDKQGVAAIIHTVAALNAMQFRDYGMLTVLIAGDEEVGSDAAKAMLTRLGAEHDATLSFEASGAANDRVSLVTSGVGSVVLRVRGRASHAGSSPERGVNALYELAHQINQMRDISDDAKGTKLNWTLARAGVVSNMIPPEAEAKADVRVRKVADFDEIEAKVRSRIKNQLLPEAQVEMVFERARPPLEPSDAGRSLAERAQAIYREIGRELRINDSRPAGGTDAAYAALKTKNAVLEHFGVHGFGAHSANAEYILIDSIEPRLYLAVRTIMDISQGKVR